MLKSSLRYGLFLFVATILSQLIFAREMEWGMALGVSVLAGIFYFLWDWAKVPYNWKKRSGD